MNKLIVPTLLVACAAVQAMRTERVASADDNCCPHGECACGINGEPTTCSFERLANLLHAVLNPPVYAPAAAEKPQPNPPQPYVIESPDILSVEFSAKVDGNRGIQGDDVAKLLLETKSQKHLVGVDGKFKLGNFGSVYVAGMTVDKAHRAIEQQLSKQGHFDDVKVTVTVAGYNSKVAYVVLEGYGLGDEVIKMPLPYPLTPATNIGALLRSAAYPQPIHFAAAEITVRRPAPNGVGEETVLPVSWDGAGPTADTNHAILPGDRIFVTAPCCSSSSKTVCTASACDPCSCSGGAETCECVTPAATIVADGITVYGNGKVNAEGLRKMKAVAAPPATRYVRPRNQPAPPQPTPAHVGAQVVYDIAFLSDCDGNLAEFKQLRETGFMLGDSETTLDALRVLEKHQLVTRTASPRMTCEVGSRASLAITPDANADDPRAGLQVEVHTRRLGKSQMAFGIRATEDGRAKAVEIVLDVYEQKTAVMKLDPPANDAGGDAKPAPDVYVVVTPTLVK